MRSLFAGLLFAHGLAHLVGFAGPWGLIDRDRVTYSSAILDGRFHLGNRGMRVIGLLWLMVALAFFVASGALASAQPWGMSAVMSAALASLVMCALGWPAARIGLAVDLVLLAVLMVGGNQGWL